MFYPNELEKNKVQIRLDKLNASKLSHTKTAGVRRKLERQIRKLEEK